MVRGSYTVEAVFIMTICVWIFMGIFYCGFYVHDRIILSSVTNESTAMWLNSAENISEKKWKQELLSELEEKLFLIQINEISSQKGIGSKKVKIRYSLPISWIFLRRILMGGENSSVYQTTRENIEPAESMWDAQIVRE